MRRTRMTIQRLMVAVVFLAIFLWSGPTLVTEAVRRWRICDERAAKYLADAKGMQVHAAQASNDHEADWCRKQADIWVGFSRRYRRARLIPWEFWTLGDRERGDFGP